MADDEGFIQHDSTYEAMAAILREIGVIAKSRSTDSKNEDFKFAFRGIEECLDVVSPLCEKHGMLTPPAMDGTPIVGSYATRSGGEMHWVLVPTSIRFQATADPDDVIVAGPFLGEAADSGDKAATKAQSVAWREIMFKTFNVPTRGEDYDTEAGNQEDKAAASAADKEAQAIAANLAGAQARGWEDLDELDQAWEDLKASGNGSSESAKWARDWAAAHKVRKGTITPQFIQEMEAVLDNAKQDGDWKANYEPPTPEGN